MSTVVLIAVGIGGSLGAIARAFCNSRLVPLLPQTLPYPTLLINILACFLMGLVAQLWLDGLVKTSLCVGFLGGFSTMSSAYYEAIDLVRNHHGGRAFLYLVLTFLASLLATFGGFGLALLLFV